MRDTKALQTSSCSAGKGSLDLDVSKAELTRRLKALKPFTPRVQRGWLARYSAHVTSADTGAVMDV